MLHLPTILRARGRRWRRSVTAVGVILAFVLACVGLVAVAPTAHAAAGQHDFVFNKDVSGRVQLFLHRANGANEQLTSDTAHAAQQGSLSADGTTAVFAKSTASGDVGEENVYSVDIATKAVRQITNLPGQELYPALSPGGAKVAFYYSSVTGSTPVGMYVINVDGTGLTRLTPEDVFEGGVPVFAPSWDHSGNRVVFDVISRNHGSMIKVVNADGSNYQTVVSAPAGAPSGFAFGPVVFTPDDRYVVYTHTTDRQIRATELATGTTVQLTNDAPANYSALSVANDWTLYYDKSSRTSDNGAETNIRKMKLGEPASDQSALDLPGEEMWPSVRRSGSIEPKPAGFMPGTGGGDPSPTSPTPGPSTPPVQVSAAFLGDSFSSGEGAPALVNGEPQYLPDTNAPGNRCHRSAAAYGPLLAQHLASNYKVKFQACSGAVINDFYAPFMENHDGDNLGEIPQLSWVTKDAKLVALTIGGNDAHFADVMQYCATRNPDMPTCKQAYGQRVKQWIDQIRNGGWLPKLYKDIKTRMAAGGKLLVLGYPRFFPKTPPKLCFSRASSQLIRTDMEWINNSIKEMNAVIRQAAKSRGATYVDVYDAFDGHELCTNDEWMNRVVPTSPAGSFHPNRQGQRALYRMARIYLP